MSYKDRKQVSLEVNRMIYCENCRIVQEVYFIQEHENQRSIYCMNCSKFIIRLVKDSQKQWNDNIEVIQGVKQIIKEMQRI